MQWFIIACAVEGVDLKTYVIAWRQRAVAKSM